MTNIYLYAIIIGSTGHKTTNMHIYIYMCGSRSQEKLFMKTHKTSRGIQQRKIEQDEFCALVRNLS